MIKRANDAWLRAYLPDDGDGDSERVRGNNAAVARVETLTDTDEPDATRKSNATAGSGFAARRGDTGGRNKLL